MRIDASGNTALLHAARAGNVSTMRLLVSHGASIDAQNKLGETIWHQAIRRDDSDDFLRAVAALYRRAKRFDRRRVMKFVDGCSPLQVCVTFISSDSRREQTSKASGVYQWRVGRLISHDFRNGGCLFLPKFGGRLLVNPKKVAGEAILTTEIVRKPLALPQTPLGELTALTASL